MENARTRAVWPGSGMPPGGSLLAARRWRGQTQLGLCCSWFRGREKDSFGKLKGNCVIGELKEEDRGACVLRYDFR